jgi:hypothetical protein
MKREKELITRSGILPSEEQTKLLKACLHKNPESTEAFHEWLNLINIPFNRKNDHSSFGLPQFFDTLDLGSQRLLSLLYKNMKSNHVQHPIVSKLEGYYKYVWYRNQILVSEFRKLAGLLFDKEIKVVLRKGLYMTVMVYNDFGTRPTVDLDITVRKEDWLKTVLILKNHGWKSKYKKEPSKINISRAHGHPFIKGDLELDLHYDFENYDLKKVTKDQMWSLSIETDGFTCLSKSNELYLTLIHGFKPNTISPIRWVVDCVLLFRQFDESDWDHLSQLISRERKKSILIMLDYLRGHEFMSFPKSINEQLNQLENIQFDLVERTILILCSKTGFWRFRYLYATFFISNSKSFRKSIKQGLNHYLYVWDKRTYWEVIFHGIMLLPKKVFKSK